MGFYNVQKGDAPYFKQLADQLLDERQLPPVRQWRHRREPHHARPRRCDLVQRRQGQRPDSASQRSRGSPERPTPARWMKSKIRIRLPAPTTGIPKMVTAAGSFGSPSFGGGSYSDCSDPTQPGVVQIVKYLQSLPRPIDPHCEAGHYYLLNNYNPGYFGNGNNAFTDTNADQHGVHDSTLLRAEHRRRADRRQDFVEVLRRSVEQLCARSVPDQLRSSGLEQLPRRSHYRSRRVLQHLQPVPVRHFHHGQRRLSAPRTSRTRPNLYSDIQNGTLPAVSFVKPSGLVDGHPASSKLNLFEGFTKKIVDAVQANPISVERHGDLHHLRRRRRLLRLGLRSAARFLRRRHAHSVDRCVSLYRRPGTSRTTIRITSPSSSSSRGTGTWIPSRTAAGTISPTRWRNGETHTCRSTVRRSAICSSCSISTTMTPTETAITMATMEATNGTRGDHHSE